MASQRLLDMLPEELREDYAMLLVGEGRDPFEWSLVKAADRICAYLKCVDELKAGNREFEMAKESTRASIKQLHMPVVERFMQQYVPSFSLTLDELN